MYDKPAPELLIAQVRLALEDGALTPGFPQKVAANALGIAARQLEQGPRQAADEATRLTALVGGEGDVEQLNCRLALAIRDGAVDITDSGVIAHLIRTTIEKIEVDQPAYPAFREWKEAGASA